MKDKASLFWDFLELNIKVTKDGHYFQPYRLGRPLGYFKFSLIALIGDPIY